MPQEINRKSLYNALKDHDIDDKLRKDIQTEYPASTTGTPTVSAYPAGPTINFKQKYFSLNPYLSSDFSLLSGFLFNKKGFLSVGDLRSLKISRLDVGTTTKDNTVYPKTSTGTPTSKNSTSPSKVYSQNYSPLNQYIDLINEQGGKSVTNSLLSGNATLPEVLKASNLDNTYNPEYKLIDDPTEYSQFTNKQSPIPGYFSTAGLPPTKFSDDKNKLMSSKMYTPTNTYLMSQLPNSTTSTSSPTKPSKASPPPPRTPPPPPPPKPITTPTIV